MPSTKRMLSLEFSCEAWDRLQEIKNLLKARDNAATIREGLRVLDWLMRESNAGWKLQLVKDNTVREIELDLKAD